MVRVEFTSTSHPSWPPQKGVVRMPALQGHWSMWPEHDGAWTRIEYQLHAQSARPDRFVAVAGYGEGGPGYICTDAALAEGGYEPTMSLVGPPSEAALKSAIEELLK